MNSEFHYYTTWFLAVKALWPRDQAARLAWACQYTDHHHRELRINTARGTVVSLPTQNYSFWDDEVIRQSFVPFHFLPSGSLPPSVRRDGRSSLREVRPNSPTAKAVLVSALHSRDVDRIGIALHTFADTWAHQNFTAWPEDFNTLRQPSGLPSPGHAQAGWRPDEWLVRWTDPRLVSPDVDNQQRFLACARKIFRYLCLFQGSTYEGIEDAVLDELDARIRAGRGRSTVEERMLEFVIDLDMDPYDRDGPVVKAVDGWEPLPLASPALESLRKLSRDLWAKSGFAPTVKLRARPGFDDGPFASWLRAADAQRQRALELVDAIPGVWS